MEDIEVEDEYFMDVEDDDEDNGWFDDDDDDVQVMKEPVLESHDSSSAPKLTSGFQFKIVDERQVSDMRQQAINEVKEILGATDDQAQSLLIQNRFNKDAALQMVFEGDQEMQGDDADEEASIFRPGAETYLCPVCFCEYTQDEVTVGPCNHYLCETCYGCYLTTAVKSGPMAVMTTCPINKCGKIIPPSMFEKICSKADYRMYEKFYLNYYVNSCREVKWCPAPSCDLAVVYPDLTSVDVYCDCGNTFCFHCEKDAHNPVECFYLRMFSDKLKEGEQTGVSNNSDLWVRVRSKNCPSCKSPIEKNAGCMHMTCGKCRYEFCWLCMGDYKKHYDETGIGLCNNYADLQKVNRAKEGEMKERSRLDMKMRKFVHYATRYKEHLNSVELDLKRGEQIKSQVNFIVSKCSNKYTLEDFDFLNKIIELVCISRRVLANTYAMRFFMKGRRKKLFFDFMQSDLERSLEALSRCLIKDITEYIEMGVDKSISLKEEFFKFKCNSSDIIDAVEGHFGRVLKQIRNDFPDIKEEESKEDIDSSDDDGGPTTKAAVQWTCYICTTLNDKSADKCSICVAPRDFKKTD